MAFEAEAEGPLRVAHGLLFKEKKARSVSGLRHVGFRINGARSKYGNVHVPIWTQRLTDIAVERVDDNLLTAFAEARVPRCCFVKERATVDVVTFNVLGCAFRHVGNAHGTNIASLATSTIL